MKTVKEFKDVAERLQTPLAELNAKTRASQKILKIGWLQQKLLKNL